MRVSSSTKGIDLCRFTFPARFGIFSVQQRSLDEDGPGKRLLVSGWWGLARHVGYFGEVLQGIGLALPGFLATGSVVPFLYPLYVFLTFLVHS